MAEIDKEKAAAEFWKTFYVKQRPRVMSDQPFQNQKEIFGFEWDSIGGFGEAGGYMDFWSFYEHLVNAAPADSTIVEVGCFHGRSLVCLGLLAKKSGKNLSIIGVDNNVMDGNSICQMNIARAGVDPETMLLAGNSTDVAQQFMDDSVFAVFIDGGHLHEIVEADMRAWMPKLRPDGWLCGHDFRMYTVAQPVCALLGRNLIYDSRWQDIWITRKCELPHGVDIHKCNGKMPEFTKSWNP